MLPRSGARALRTLRVQPARAYVPLRTYAKVGKPKPPEFKHTASNVATPKKATATDNTYKPGNPVRFAKEGGAASDISSKSASTSNFQARSTEPKSQNELDSEAVDAMPTAAESESKKAIGEQAEHEQPSAEGRIPLHDITKGIPSTLDAELREAARRQRAAEQGEEAEAGPEETAKQSSGGGGGGRGDRPVRDYTTSAERRRNRIMGWFAASFGILLLTGPIYLGRNWENEDEVKRHPDAPNGWGVQLFIDRVRARLSTTMDYYNEPNFPKLLPDITDPQLERPYTLVLSLEDLLIHGEWTRENGWRIAKRPGLDYFLRYLHQHYEIVIFTSAPSMIAMPVLEKLDPIGVVPMRLFREATRYSDGKHIKDLSYLNRPLDKIILIDTDPSHAEAQPENAIILPKWTGDANDKELIALIPFLEYTSAMGLSDTRKVLESFKGKHIPSEFAIREAAARKRWKEQMGGDRRSRRSGSGLGAIGSALGIRADQGAQFPGQLTLNEGLAQGKMLHDVIRENSQKQYEFLEKQIRDNQEQWLAEQKEANDLLMKESMQQMKQGFFGWFGGAPKETESSSKSAAATTSTTAAAAAPAAAK